MEEEEDDLYGTGPPETPAQNNTAANESDEDEDDDDEDDESVCACIFHAGQLLTLRRILRS